MSENFKPARHTTQNTPQNSSRHAQQLPLASAQVGTLLRHQLLVQRALLAPGAPGHAGYVPRHMHLTQRRPHSRVVALPEDNEKTRKQVSKQENKEANKPKLSSKEEGRKSSHVDTKTAKQGGNMDFGVACAVSHGPTSEKGSRLDLMLPRNRIGSCGDRYSRNYRWRRLNKGSVSHLPIHSHELKMIMSPR